MVTPAEGAAGRQLRRDVSPLGLMFVSLGSIIGSGWLFGALYASQIAGPAAIIAWVAGGLVMLLLALVHAELRSMYPVAGVRPAIPSSPSGAPWGSAWRRSRPAYAGLQEPHTSHARIFSSAALARGMVPAGLGYYWEGGAHPPARNWHFTQQTRLQ